MSDGKSVAAKAIEAMRPHEESAILDGIFGLAGKEILEVMVRVPTKKLEDDAVVAAHVYMASREVFDHDLLEDAKAIEIVFRCFFDVDGKLPAFPGPQWMREHLSGSQLGQLLAILAAVKESAIHAGD